MLRRSIASEYGALYPEELLSRYESGERDFTRINLLREEIEYIASTRGRPLHVPPLPDKRSNVLWSDFRNLVEHEFEWDGFGHFIPVEYDDLLPPRDLSGASLTDIRLDGSYLYPVDLSGANLCRATLRRAMLFDINLRGADLSYTDLRRATIEGDLSRANLYMARLDGCVLRGTAAGADFGRAKLMQADLSGLDLRQASLANAHFGQTNLSGADLRGIAFDDVKFKLVCASGVKLETRQIDTFLRSLAIVLDDTGGGPE